jgi:outer membrane receptor for ferrienterochelin and colicins
VHVRKRITALLACGFLALPIATAQSREAPAVADLFKLPLEEFMDVEVTTAARVAERVGDIPASVVLVSRSEIEAFGYTTLAEILDRKSVV